MTVLLIDTCIWLNLAKNKKGEEKLSLLEKYIEESEVSLIVPRIILTEFNRNKDKIVKKAKESLSSHFGEVKKAIKEHGSKENKEIVLSQLNDVDYKIPTLGESAFNAIQRIEKLFSNSEILEITDEIKLKAAQRAIDKKAPFHLNKNSVGDAIIIESYIDFKTRNKFQEFKLMLITDNKSDFSVTNGDKNKPHEDLNNVFDSPKSQYFINLYSALKVSNPALIDNIELENEWVEEPRGITEIIETEYEFTEKIWYNRHKNREYKIEIGEIAIIDRKDFDSKNSNTTIVNDIWEGAKKSAQKIEAKYGKENLIWDDFEWGMINGKLSALRWVRGEEWDSLYT